MDSETKPQLFSVEWCRRQKYPLFNRIKLLRSREIGFRKEGSHFIKGCREFYNSITLTNSIHSKDCPQFLPISFSPNGNFFIGLHLSLQNIIIYRYKGIRNIQNFKDQIFQNFFSHQITIPIYSYNRAHPGILSRDSVFFTDDSRHLIIGSSLRVSATNSKINGGIQRNNESLAPGAELENYKFYSICLKKFEIVDELNFNYDYLDFASGVHMIDRKIVILSVLHQTIYIYYVNHSDGFFISHAEFGRTLYNDNYRFPNTNPLTERCFTAPSRNLINANKISPIFVIFDVENSKFLGIFDSNSDEFFEMVENSMEAFRNGNLIRNRYPSSKEHVPFFRKESQQLIEINGKAIYRRDLIKNLPFGRNLSGPNISPYLDPYLFRYNEKILFNLERRRYSPEYKQFPGKENYNHSLSVFNRKTKRLGIHLEPMPREYILQNGLRYNIIMHPFEPFGISTTNLTSFPFNTFITYFLPDFVLSKD